MLKVLQRAISTVDQRLLLLMPPDTEVPDHFNNFEFDGGRHREVMREVQRFRGDIYYQDGAVGRHQLTADGLHQTPEDDNSWHLVMVNRQDRITACAWFRDHDNHVYLDRLRLKSCPLASAPEFRDKLWKAVDVEIWRAREAGLRYAEVGGWAVAHESRGTSDGLIVALAAYSLGRICGGALGITTATTRHGSSSILCRMGGSRLELEGSAFPPYFDPHYQCLMEILRFDSRKPTARFSGAVELLHERLADVPVVVRPYWPLAPRLGQRSVPAPITAPTAGRVAARLTAH
jgi:hypothetical protein